MIKIICVNHQRFNFGVLCENTFSKYFLVLIIISCTHNGTNPEIENPLEVNIRIKVQILDSTYQLYSRPFTKIYFTSYKLTKDNNLENFEQSDTTSCPNGWGVKPLSFILNNEQEKIVIGAACESYGDNYREFLIYEAERGLIYWNF